MGLVHPYRLSNEELSYMTDKELQDYIDELEIKARSAKGYGLKQFQREIKRAKRLLRTTEK